MGGEVAGKGEAWVPGGSPGGFVRRASWMGGVLGALWGEQHGQILQDSCGYRKRETR